MSTDAISEVGEFTSSAPAVPLTDVEWKRALRGRKFWILVKPEEQERAAARGIAVHCIACRHAPGEKHRDPWGSFCIVHRCEVSNTFPKLCRQYERSEA